ncbi:M28 family metallopeptidase [soil metagenome]
MLRIISLILCLIVGGTIAVAQARPPAPVGADAPKTAYSAGRAMADIRVIAARPHPIGSAANAAVRDYLVGRMTGLGLSPRIQSADVVVEPKPGSKPSLTGARVENIVGMLPGLDPDKPALAIMAHYDSVPNSPGAADDATGVAAALEIVRALAAQGKPERDVVVLITDGEEMGLLGAKAFFEQDSLARHIGLVLNMEARGGGGRVAMFETSDRNGGLIDLFKSHAVRPFSSSLSIFVYQKMPNGTDLTRVKDAGVAGMNFAFLGRQFDYHSASSTPANLDQGSVQDMQEVLATARAAAFAADLPKAQPDRVYSQIGGALILAYPPMAGWLLLAMIAALLVVAVVRARRLTSLTVWDGLRGVGAVVVLILASVVVFTVARWLTGARFGYLEQRALMPHAPLFEIGLFLVGFGLLAWTGAASASRGRALAVLILVLGGVCAAIGVLPIAGIAAAAAVLAWFVFSKPLSTSAGWLGLLLTALVAGLAAQILAPTAAQVIVWPLAWATLAAALTALAAAPKTVDWLILGAVAAVALALDAAFAHFLYLALDLPALLTAPVWLASLALWPLVRPREPGASGTWIGAGALAAGLLISLTIRLLDPYSARHPEATSITYVSDADTGRAWLTSNSPVDPWSKAVLTAGGPISKQMLEPFFRAPIDAAPTKAVGAAAPEITFTKGEGGAMVLHVGPQPGLAGLVLTLKPSVELAGFAVNGRGSRITAKAGEATLIRWFVPAEGLTVTFTPAGPGGLDLQYAAFSHGWPAGATPLPKRPANVMPFGDSDIGVVRGSKRFSW